MRRKNQSQRHRRQARQGFTLVEMLVIVGIIGILASVMLGSFQYVRTTAWQSRAQRQVSQLATALTVYLQNERAWHPELLANQEVNERVCAVLQRARLFDLTTWSTLPTERADRRLNTDGALNARSPDRFGLLNPWGRARMRRQANINEAQVRQFRLQYRLDRNLDGYVDAGEGAPQGVRVRAAALVWSRGPDGQDDFASSNPKASARYPFDDRLSWTHGQALRGN